MIFTEECFESLKNELKCLKPRQPKQKISDVKTVPKVSVEPLPQKAVHEYEASDIWTAYDGKQWRWRRMYDWFNQFTLDDRQGASLENILKHLQT